MKRIAILLGVGVFLAVSCEKSEQESQVSNVSFTPCQQSKLRSSGLSDKVDVAFTDKGVQITHYDFEVPCDFTTVNVTHTFVNGVLNITQQGTPNLADCICHTDVSYTINGISKNEVNVIFINGTQVYCYNENGISACGVTDPAKNLPWLTKLIETAKTDNTGNYLGRIWLEKFKGQDIFVTNMMLGSGGVAYWFFDCLGNHLLSRTWEYETCPACNFVGNKHFFIEDEDFQSFVLNMKLDVIIYSPF